ncbi:sensor histidine kinase [Spiractinospora alimapuensis]|nr:sensor histidine kinase [Spiractinospora alimapuensis]
MRYLLGVLLSGVTALLALHLVLVGVALIPAGGLGLVVLPRVMEFLTRATEAERRRGSRYLGEEFVSRPDERPPHTVLARWNHVMRSASTWRTARFLLVWVPLGVAYGLLGVIALLGTPSALIKASLWWLLPGGETTFFGVGVTNWPFAIVGGLGEGVAFAALFWWGAPFLARGYARLVVRLTSPSEIELRAERLSERVEELSHTRAEALRAHGSELRRIERDLHDGTQARLVALAMRVGIAERMVSDDPEKAVHLLREARSGAEDAMAELRDVIRTMYPPILTDRGLDGAVSAVAGRCAVPTSVRMGELGSLPAAVEAAAYFVIAETLTNVAKHSQARSAQVDLSRDGAELTIRVVDDGVGGALEHGGTGLAGLRRRVAALDGTTTVTSPAGGPTTVEAVLPCAS